MELPELRRSPFGAAPAVDDGGSPAPGYRWNIINAFATPTAALVGPDGRITDLVIQTPGSFDRPGGPEWFGLDADGCPHPDTITTRMYTTADAVEQLRLPTAPPRGPDVYDRDDVDEMTLGALGVLAKVRAQLATAGVLTPAVATVIDSYAAGMVADRTDD